MVDHFENQVCNDALQSNMQKYLLIALAMQLPEDWTCTKRLIKKGFFVPFMKLLNCKSLFPTHWKITLDCMESPLCFGFSALGLDRNIF